MKLLSLMVLTAALASGQVSAEVQLKAAMHKEEVEGDLKGAIEAYRKIVAQAGSNRAVAAKALYQLGECYRKQGDAEARKTFERLVKEFGDQPVAAEARARLAAMSGKAGGETRARLVWDNATDLWGSVSADGRYLSFVNWNAPSIDIRDLVTGENLNIGQKGGPEKGKGEPGGNAISPDGKRVAFAYMSWDRPRDKRENDELHVIGADGSGHKILVRGQGIYYIEPYSWSPDGKWIAASISDAKGNSRIATVSSDDGQIRYIPTRDGTWKSKVTFSPDGKWLAYSTFGKPELSITPAEASSVAEVTLQENANMMGWTPDGKGILFSRERDGTHDLYLLPVSNGRASGEAQRIFTTSDVGSISFGVTSRGALLFGTFNRRADALMFAWNGDVSRLGEPLATFPVTAEVGMLLGGGALRYSPDGKRLLGVTPARGLLIRELASGSEQAITVPLKRGTRVEWGHDSASLLVLGQGEDGKTGVYRLGLATGPAEFVAPTPVLDQAWHFVPSRDGKTIFYGSPKSVFARDLATGSEKLLWDQARGGNFQLQLSRDGTRLAIRCGGYLGIVEVASGQVRDLYVSPENSHEAIWATEWSADDRQLLTIVRATGSTDAMEFRVFPAGGGAPTRQPIPKEFHGLALSPDGKYLATSRLTRRVQVWALENFLPKATR